MRISLQSALFLFLTATVAAGACGGNVVVDMPQTGTGGVTTSTVGTGAVVTTGPGTTTTVGTGGVTTVSVSSSSGIITTDASSTSGSTTSSTGGVGACTDGLDAMIMAGGVLWPGEVKCAMANPGNPAALQMCVQAATGLTLGCAACVAQDLGCGIQHCLNQCLSAPNSQTCIQCRLSNCATSFQACSGLPHQNGSTNCSMLYGNGPTSKPWVQGLTAADFTTSNAWAAYEKYGTCACNLCPQCQMDYCSGTLTASPTCASCIQQQCGSGAVAFCETN